MSLEFASMNLRNEKQIVLVAVKNNGFSLKFVSDDLKNDRDVVLEAVR
jgi:hypothetical protein